VCVCTGVLMVLLSVANAMMTVTTPDPGTMMTTKSMMMNSTEGGGMTVAVTTPAMAPTTHEHDHNHHVRDQSLSDCHSIYAISLSIYITYSFIHTALDRTQGCVQNA